VILTAKVANNSQVFNEILSLYSKEGNTIADVTYGTGKFWKETDSNKYKLLASDLSEGTDCRNLSYDDNSIDILVFDPPYIYNPKRTVKLSISDTYNINETLDLPDNNAVLQLYQDGMKEGCRVLKKNGYMIVKCQDIIESGKQKWNHIGIFNFANDLGLRAEDLFVVVQQSIPCQRWKVQKHARKNHSYFWVFKSL